MELKRLVSLLMVLKNEAGILYKAALCSIVMNNCARLFLVLEDFVIAFEDKTITFLPESIIPFITSLENKSDCITIM